MSEIYLGTVAIEPNRWATIDPSWCPTIRLSDWLDDISAAGFDGIEVWEKHLTEADEAEVEAVLEHPLPIQIFNSYVSFEPEDSAQRVEAAAWVRRSGAAGVKFNTGNEAASRADYSRSLADFAALLPAEMRLLCECHVGISLAEDPAVAAQIFDEAGGGAQYQAITHLGEDPEFIRSKFEHLADRVTHVHVNFLESGGAPRLSAIEERVVAQVELLAALGFSGTWTLEFAEGLLTDNDEPAYLLESAAADLEILRRVIDGG